MAELAGALNKGAGGPATATKPACKSSEVKEKPGGADQSQTKAAYDTWRSASPLLYDNVQSHALLWPSLSCQWLPSEVAGAPHLGGAGTEQTVRKEGGKDVTGAQAGSIDRYSIVLGTQVEHGPNTLSVVGVALPSEQSQKTGVDAFPHPGPANFSTDIYEYRTLRHYGGEVHRLRCMPQQPSLVATRTPECEIDVYDLGRGCEASDEKMKDYRLCTLVGNSHGGWGLAWSSVCWGRLLSTADDGRIGYWNLGDIDHASSKVRAGAGRSRTSSCQASCMLVVELGVVVESVDWSPAHSDVFASGSDRGKLCLWDARRKGCAAASRLEHGADVNCVAFNPHVAEELATASTDACVRVWDIRRFSTPLHTYQGHKSMEVFTVAWAPFSRHVLASTGDDRRVCIWDMRLQGTRVVSEEDRDTQPELLFVHGGHTDRVSDVSWHPSRPWLLSSVAEDNILQVWEPSRYVQQVSNRLRQCPTGAARRKRPHKARAARLQAQDKRKKAQTSPRGST